LELKVKKNFLLLLGFQYRFLHDFVNYILSIKTYAFMGFIVAKNISN